MKNYEKELVVIKVGSSTLEQTDGENVTLCQESFQRIAEQSARLAVEGASVVIVSSGAVSAGYAYTNEHRAQTHDTLSKQRYACLGQTSLMLAWQNAFAFGNDSNCNVAQLLFTKHELDTDEGKELLAVSKTLLNNGDIIIANENDALSHDGISFGDNDTLSARFASLLHTSGLFQKTSLVILSDIHGVYADRNDSSTIISEINNIDNWVHVAKGSGSVCGTGGMKSKFEAAQRAIACDIDTYITHGRTNNSVINALNRTAGTCFSRQH